MRRPARRLRWPVGTVKSRLVRGRRQLSGRLARRGLAPASRWPPSRPKRRRLRPAPVPLVLAVAATRAALASSVRCGTAATAGPVSRSIASLVHKGAEHDSPRKARARRERGPGRRRGHPDRPRDRGRFGTRGPAIGPSLPRDAATNVGERRLFPRKCCDRSRDTAEDPRPGGTENYPRARSQSRRVPVRRSRAREQQPARAGSRASSLGVGERSRAGHP